MAEQFPPAWYQPYPHQLTTVQTVVPEILPFPSEHTGITYAALVWARRHGKDITAWITAIARAMRYPGSMVLYTASTLPEIERIIFEARDQAGRLFIDYIPKAALAKKPVKRPFIQITFKNGSVIHMMGNNKASKIVGANYSTIVASEAGLYKIKDLIAFAHPMLQGNQNRPGGSLFLFPSTLRPGCELEQYFLAWKKMQEEEGTNTGIRYFTSMVSGEDDMFDPKITEYLHKMGAIVGTSHDKKPLASADDIREARKLGIPADRIASEYYNFPVASARELIYGSEMSRLVAENRVLPIFRNFMEPTFAAFDYGKDGAVEIVYQIDRRNNSPVILDSFHEENADFLDFVEANSVKLGYKPDLLILPYDLERKVRGVSEQGRVQAANYQTALTEKIGKKEYGLDTTARLLATMQIGMTAGAQELKTHLMQYKRKLDASTGQFGLPVHDKASHYADATQTLALGFNKALYYTKEPTSTIIRPIRTIRRRDT